MQSTLEREFRLRMLLKAIADASEGIIQLRIMPFHKHPFIHKAHIYKKFILFYVHSRSLTPNFKKKKFKVNSTEYKSAKLLLNSANKLKATHTI
ncbi:hypothetical protein STEG23_014112, partial [Scotinomys teguina]